MAGGIDLNFNIGGKRRQREKDARELYFQLIDRGASVDVANDVAGDYIKTGRLNVPNERIRMVPPAEGIGPENEVREPIRLQKSTSIIPYDYSTGAMGAPVSVPAGSKTFGFGSRQQTQGDVPLYVFDDETGTLTQVGTGPRGAKVVKKSAPKGPSESPQQRIARETIARYETALAKGQATAEMAEAAESAAKFLGLQTERPVTEKPSFVDRVQNVASHATGGKVPPAKPRMEEGAPVIKFGGGSNKQLTPEIAAKYLELAKRDRKKAEEMARRDGYRF